MIAQTERHSTCCAAAASSRLETNKNKTMPSAKLTAVTLVGSVAAVATQQCAAFAPATTTSARFATSTQLNAKGRKSKDLADIGGGAAGGGVSSKGVKGLGEDAPIPASAGRAANWVPVAGMKSMADLPKDENKVKFVDTMADQLIDGAVNPTGAVSVINYKGKTYCFASSCPSCKVPLAKAKILDPTEETGSDPRVCCDFCSATFSVRTGDRVEDAGGAGFLGGIVKGLMNSQEKVPLKTYDLGEKNGKVLINLP